MSLLLTDSHNSSASSAHDLSPEAARSWTELREQFQQNFALVDGETGEVLLPGEVSFGNWSVWGALCRELATAARPQILLDEPPLVAIAIPLLGVEPALVAVGMFLAEPEPDDEQLRAAAQILDCAPQTLADWAARRADYWSPAALERAAAVLCKNWQQARQLAKQAQDIDQLAANLASTYEEISLVYRLTQSLKLSCRDEDLGRLALQWLTDAVPVEALAVQFLPLAEASTLEGESRHETVLLTEGPCPLDNEQFSQLVAPYALQLPKHPIVINPPLTQEPSWPFPQIRQLVLVPLVESGHLFGWIAAFNHLEDRELGTVEGSLLGSVASILGIHSSNTDLYRQQSELLSGTIRALTSAIDAKDPYTCGHSDRVARVAVRLGRELDCTTDQLKWLYLSGLLHDVGKIGIDQEVLRKPGRLTETEYEHIQTHAPIGFRILDGIKQLDQVLPVVLHHHEAWDGTGYPSRLSGDSIPLLARIVAVADSYDAMGSDRPYRKGMPIDRLEEIFQAGSGKQWDAAVIEAYFRARADIHGISDEKRCQITLDPIQWM
ncbi:MAG TPA: HD-GYP domain-containing protein [Pirellulales bacterium]|jgi:HD-GYP domain-containing protein (c-di-GMP phosphodiesterase class II)|nr:HD-GYP domain-containing protein [Pirellulales bacterium]